MVILLTLWRSPKVVMIYVLSSPDNISYYFSVVADLNVQNPHPHLQHSLTVPKTTKYWELNAINIVAIKVDMKNYGLEKNPKPVQENFLSNRTVPAAPAMIFMLSWLPKRYTPLSHPTHRWPQTLWGLKGTVDILNVSDEKAQLLNSSRLSYAIEYRLMSKAKSAEHSNDYHGRLLTNIYSVAPKYTFQTTPLYASKILQLFFH